MRVRERLKTEIKFFFSKCLFCILISLSQNTIYLNLNKKYVFSEGEQLPLTDLLSLNSPPPHCQGPMSPCRFCFVLAVRGRLETLSDSF